MHMSSDTNLNYQVSVRLRYLKILFFLAIAVTGVIGFIWGFPGQLAEGRSSVPDIAGMSVNTDKPDRQIIRELLTLHPFGFDPAELTIPSGNFLLAVDNLSGQPVINLTLVEEKKSKLRDIKIESKNRDWREELDLKPGIYILSEASNPRWTCRITVTDARRVP